MKTYESDVLIIGGGVAGALVADSLTKSGKKVILIEAGTKVDRSEAYRIWATSGSKTPGSAYRTGNGQKWAPFPDSEGDYSYRNGSSPFKSFYIRRQGGSTLAWQGSAPRLIPSDFRMWSEYGVGVDWPITYDDLERWYSLAEQELGVGGKHEEWNGFHGAHRTNKFPLNPIPQTYSDLQFKQKAGNLVIDGIEAMVRSTPQARTSDCGGAGTCIPICLTEAKYDAVRHLNILEKRDNFTVAYATVAINLDVDSGKVVGATAVNWDAAKPEQVQYRAKCTVIACHAIESVRLLLGSKGINDRSGLIGCNLMDHPTGQLAGLSPEPWFPFRSPPVTSGIDNWRDGRFRSLKSAWKLSLGNDGLGRFKRPDAIIGEWLDSGVVGKMLTTKITEDATRWFRISWATEQLPDPANRVYLTGQKDVFGVPQVELAYNVGTYTMSAYPWIRSVVRTLFRAAGITELPNQEPPAGREVYGGSGHIMGTTKMGATAETSVVDAYCRMHLHPELRVIGSCVFPTGGTANPTLTIAALALRAAGDILKELR